MKLCPTYGALCFCLAVSVHPLFAQPYSFDENGHGTSTISVVSPPAVYPLPVTVGPDPTSGITGSPVLIYSLGSSVVPGDVDFMAPDGTTVADVLRFFTPAGGTGSDVIFYSQVGGGTLADVGIPAPGPFSVAIPEVGPITHWRPALNQPGAQNGPAPVYASYYYDVNVTAVPEPSTVALLTFITSGAMILKAWRGKHWTIRSL